MKFIIFITTLTLISTTLLGKGLNVYGLGVYDIKFDGSEKNQTTDFRYENRFSNTLFDIGPKEDNFFFLRPFVGFEFKGDENDFIFTPSFGFGYYNDGEGKKLGNEIQFRTTLEISYELKNKNRIGLSFGHISNANLGDKNPGVEILSLSYQIPY